MRHMRTQFLTYASRPMWRSYSTVLAAIVFLGCTKTNPVLECDKTGACTDPRFPFCDATGSIAGDPGRCIAVSCTAGTFAACDGENAVVCDAAGTNYQLMSCPNGCDAAQGGCIPCQPNMKACGDHTLYTCDASGAHTAETCAAGCVDGTNPHCAILQPRHLPGVCDTPGQGTLEIASNTTFDTAVDSNCTGGLVQQSGGPEICVVRNASMHLASSAKLRIVNGVTTTREGNVKDRPIAIVVDDDLSIEGVVDASSEQASGVASPGGGYQNDDPGQTGTSTVGLGGAGFATAGGDGGSFQADGGAMNGGPQLPNPLNSAVFAGGPSALGNGGGGVLLVSCHGTVSISGSVQVGGAGGPSGYISGFLCASGLGGGAGGNVLIEAMDINITGSLFANGGGGGAGCINSFGLAGGDGPMSDTMAAFGGTAASGAGAGGIGGLGVNLPGKGATAQMSAGGHPGGGGGSVGWLQTSTPDGATPMLTPAHVSPPLQPNAISTTK